MKVIIDLKLLKELLSFDYLEVFELDSLNVPTSFTEHPVPAEVALPKDSRSQVVSRLANMRFARTPEKSVVHIPKDELPANWDFNIVGVSVSGKQVPLVLFFHSHELSNLHIDGDKLSPAIQVM